MRIGNLAAGHAGMRSGRQKACAPISGIMSSPMNVGGRIGC
jgi:hypothetical protein